MPRTSDQSPPEPGAAAPQGWFGRSPDRLVLALVAAVLALRLVSLALNATDLYYDEAQYWAWAQELDFGYYSKPPLLAWLIAATTIFGDTPFFVRLASPVLHCATALILYGLGKRLVTPRAGLVSALIWLTMPGVSLSSHIISTDVPLLFFWSLALFAFARFMERRRLADALLLGVAIGLGLNSKYAMGYLPPILILFAASSAETRPLLRDPRFWAALLLGLVLLVPNIVWNAQHHFATFAHTRDNADWHGL
ncbi:MAG: glycosyltransferase family 39 protein, partial [Rhizobiales bacterium]|nr:glycosyltransferase family 39 protein [Hyphomicrobiales bacterium]